MNITNISYNNSKILVKQETKDQLQSFKILPFLFCHDSVAPKILALILIHSRALY